LTGSKRGSTLRTGLGHLFAGGAREETKMADESELELRILELENKLRDLGAEPEPMDLTAADVAAYNKVVKAIPILRCGRGCGRNCASACIALAEEDMADSLAVACSCGRSCGRGCGRSCGCIRYPPPVLSAAEETLAVGCRGCGRGCGCGGCRVCYYMAACECSGGGCSPGAAQPSPRARGGVDRFANLGE
jgi:hypothetical protein